MSPFKTAGLALTMALLTVALVYLVVIWKPLATTSTPAYAIKSSDEQRLQEAIESNRHPATSSASVR